MQNEKEVFEKEVFSYRKSREKQLQTVEEGDIGFLLNPVSKKLYGIFIAEEKVVKAKYDVSTQSDFPIQIKVRLLDDLQTVPNAIDRLSSIISLKKIKSLKGYTFVTTERDTYGPDITDKVLSLFEHTDEELISGTVEKTKIENKEVGYKPEIDLDNVAGLLEVKRFIHQRVIAPFQNEELASELGLRIGGGMLLYGPPGTGKTLIAQSVASKLDAKFYEMSPSVLVGFPGEAEQRIEEIFADLQSQPRSVLFLDEAEWVLGKREEQKSSVMQRIIPVMLAQLSKLFKERKKQIIIVAATNKPELLDSAFLRPGRFDKIFYVGLPDREAITYLLRINLEKRSNNLKDEEYHEISEKLDGYSGADIEQIVEEAAYLVFERDPQANPGDAMITGNDLREVIEKTPRSVVEDDIKKLQKWRDRIMSR